MSHSVCVANLKICRVTFFELVKWHVENLEYGGAKKGKGRGRMNSRSKLKDSIEDNNLSKHNEE